MEVVCGDDEYLIIDLCFRFCSIHSLRVVNTLRNTNYTYNMVGPAKIYKYTWRGVNDGPQHNLIIYNTVLYRVRRPHVWFTDLTNEYNNISYTFCAPVSVETFMYPKNIPVRRCIQFLSARTEHAAARVQHRQIFRKVI